jgi:hypothetical protein
MKRFLLAAAALLAFSGSAFAQCTGNNCISFKIPDNTAKYLVSQNVEVGDIPGHIVRLFETTGVPDNAAIGGLKIIQVTVRGTGELYSNSAVATGFATFVADNGDKLFARAGILGETPPNGKPHVSWVGRITNGTGKLSGLHRYHLGN